jgi:transcriptional regulator with XRE-family HTH domain
MTMHPRTDYEEFESSSTTNRRLLRQEELILEVTETLAEALAREGITKTELAARLGKTKAFVSQILAGNRNLTLRTLADVAEALHCRVNVKAHRKTDSLALDRRETVRYVAPLGGSGEWSPRLLRPMFGKLKEHLAA